MTDNELVNGEVRLGWLTLANPSLPPIAAMLKDTGFSIEISVPLRDLVSRQQPYSRWWTGSIVDHGGNDGGYGDVPPRVMQFRDTDGFIVLIGCRKNGYKTVVGGTNSGYGRIVANYALLGGRSFKYEKINGMRSDMPAFLQWIRLNSVTVERQHDEDGRLRSAQVEMVSMNAVSLSKKLNLSMHSTWEGNKKLGQFVAQEHVVFETNVKDSKSWDEHISVHGAMLDLVSISAWRPFGFGTIEVLRHDDSKSGPNGKKYDRWCRVVTHRLFKNKELSDDSEFLFPFSEVGPAGVKRWFSLRKDYDEALDPLFSILRSEDSLSDSNVVQSGLALECLGYLIDIKKNNGAHFNRRKQISFGDALNVIVADMTVTPFKDASKTEEWVKRATAVYMGLKHYDRDTPDTLDSLNTLRDNLNVVRFWVALQIGAQPKTLSENLERDPLSKRFTEID